MISLDLYLRDYNIYKYKHIRYMNELGLYDTPEEIADAILSKVNSLGTIRKATINSKCNNEAMFNKVLDLLKEQGSIDFDSNFIFKNTI